MPFRPQVEQWRPLLGRLGPDLPINFLLAWLEKESGGNPCALGIPGVEAGIFQTFHPADDRFGGTFGQLRSACSGSKLTRPLNGDEAQLQARVGVNFVRAKRDITRGRLRAVGARWSESSPDFWIAVKQEHALPCVTADLLPRVTKRLGRAPKSWTEFRNAVMAMSSSDMAGSGCQRFAASPSKAGRRNRLEDTLANAEEVGAFGGGSVASTVIKLALVAALAFGAYTIWTGGEPAESPPPQ